MYISIAVYVLLVLLLFWGAKFSGFKSKFHDDFLSLEKTKSIRGIAALCVLLHHISQEEAFQHVGELRIFVLAGPLLVSLFFFCSGFGLVKAYYSKPDYLNGFLKKRIVKGVLITFYVNVILYFIYHLIMGHSFPPVRWVTNFIGLTLMNEYAWFPVVLILLYLAFYLIFKYVKNNKLRFFLMLLVILLQGMFFCVTGHFAWWAGKKNWWLAPMAFEKAKWWMQEKVIWFFGQWWVNSSIGFFIGMIFAQFEKQIVGWFKKAYWIKFIILIALTVFAYFVSQKVQADIGYYTEWSGKGAGVTDKIITYFAEMGQVAFWVIFVFILTMKISFGNSITKFFGKYSFDTYLMNLAVIDACRVLLYKNDVPVYKAGNYNLILYIVAVIAFTVILGVLENFIVERIKKHIK